MKRFAHLLLSVALLTSVHYSVAQIEEKHKTEQTTWEKCKFGLGELFKITTSFGGGVLVGYKSLGSALKIMKKINRNIFGIEEDPNDPMILVPAFCVGFLAVKYIYKLQNIADSAIGRALAKNKKYLEAEQV